MANVTKISLSESKQSSLDRLSTQAKRATIAEADIIVVTTVHAGFKVLDNVEFSQIFVDESGLIPEEQAHIFLAKGAEQVIMIGDQQQLKARQVMPEAERMGIQSLFSRLADRNPEKVHLLKEYRRSASHPLIHIVNILFYNGELRVRDDDIREGRRLSAEKPGM